MLTMICRGFINAAPMHTIPEVVAVDVPVPLLGSIGTLASKMIHFVWSFRFHFDWLEMFFFWSFWFLSFVFRSFWTNNFHSIWHNIDVWRSAKQTLDSWLLTCEMEHGTLKIVWRLATVCVWLWFLNFGEEKTDRHWDMWTKSQNQNYKFLPRIS